MKTWFPFLAIFFFLLLLVELSCFAFFSVFHERFTFYDPKNFVLEEGEIPKAERVYDKNFGWKHPYKTQFGERPRPKDFGKPLISMFGDSYTHCDQVQNNETLQTYLARLLRADVYNFGVGGFGTDQAYLRFLQDYPKVKTPIVVLGLITENINRVHNVFRPFYFEKTRGLLPKPRFELVDDQLRLIENPIHSQQEIPKLMNSNFIEGLGEYDWWYNRDRYPIFSLPYSGILLSKRMWLELIYGKGDSQVDDMDPRPWENLWEVKSARDLMFKIFDSFVEKANSFDAKPIIMIFPRKRESWEKFRGKEPQNVSTILEFCKQRRYVCFDSVSALVSRAESEEDLRSFYNGHLSARGNRVLAREFYRFLKDLNILEE